MVPEKNTDVMIGRMASKIDSLLDMVEREYQERKDNEARLRSVELKVNSLFIIGPVLIGISALVSPFISWGK